MESFCEYSTDRLNDRRESKEEELWKFVNQRMKADVDTEVERIDRHTNGWQ